MDKPSYKLVGSPCGQHGQYTFYKALRLTGERERIVAIGDFFFVRVWQDSELVSIGELQLLWTDRVSDQTLVSLRLYFLPENTPDGRHMHGEDEVLVINEKVVLKAEDLLSWVCDGSGWRYGLRAVWRAACAPSTEQGRSDPLHHTRMDFSDVEREKSAIAVDSETPGVVVFSYPRYCRYRALESRLEGIQASWLRDSLVAALGGYAAPTKNTRILYCKDTFEYPELEGHEFVCNHLAPRLKGRPRGRRRRPPRSRSHSPSSRSSDSDVPPPPQYQPPGPKTPRRLSLRNGVPEKQSEGEDDERTEVSPEDRAFLQQLRQFYRGRNDTFRMAHSLKDLSLRALYASVSARGGYEAVCRHKLWRVMFADRPARVRNHYERFLLPFENHERERNGKHQRPNGRIDQKPIATIDVTDSPLRELPEKSPEKPDKPEKRLRTPSPKPELEIKEDFNTTSKPAEELNQEFLDSLPKEEKPLKLTIKPVEKLLEPGYNNVLKLFEENRVLVAELAAKHSVMDPNKVIDEIGSRKLSEGSSTFLSELAQRLNLGNSDTTILKELGKDQESSASALTSLSTLGDKYAVNGHATNGAGTTQQKSARPAGRSSLRHVRVKPTRPSHTAANTPPIPPLRPDSGSTSSSPPSATTPVSAAHTPTNFGIQRPPHGGSDDEIVEVPYKPKTPEIIDLDEYPESPQSQVKKKKLDILKERGLEVTAIPTTVWGTVPPPVPLGLGGINPPMMLNPAMQHQIMTQASIFQMYNIIPQNYANGIQPPKVIQATCIYGNTGPEKTVYGNPKDPYMEPPHILRGTPVKIQRNVAPQPEMRPQDILDLTCKTGAPTPKPAVEIVRIPNSPSPSKSTPQNLSKNYTLVDGKAVVGSNLEITLVNPKVATPPKNRPPQKRSSNGKFISTKTPTPPKDYPKPYPTASTPKKNPIVVPSYQITRDDVSPTSSTGSRDSQTSMMQNAFKNQQSLSQMMDMQKAVPTMSPYMDPLYMSALYNSLAGQMDQRQLAMYREFMANQFRGYSGLLGAATPTTKN